MILCCRRLRFDPDAEIPMNRPTVDLMLEWAAFASSPPGSSTRRQVVHFGVGGDGIRPQEGGSGQRAGRFNRGRPSWRFRVTNCPGVTDSGPRCLYATRTRLVRDDGPYKEATRHGRILSSAELRLWLYMVHGTVEKIADTSGSLTRTVCDLTARSQRLASTWAEAPSTSVPRLGRTFFARRSGPNCSNVA